jgi:hypothetical protein
VRRWWLAGSLLVLLLLASLALVALPGEVVLTTGVIETVQPVDTQAGPRLSGSVRLESGERVTVSLPRGSLVGEVVRLSATRSILARQPRYHVLSLDRPPSARD